MDPLQLADELHVTQNFFEELKDRVAN